MSAAPVPAPVKKTPKVVLIGPTNSGKTTYFGILERALGDRSWTVQVVRPGQGLARRTLHDDIRNEISQGRFPRKTAVKEKSEDLFFAASKTGPVSKAEARLELSFFDPPGELFEPALQSPVVAAAKEQLFTHMSDCDGILVLLDLRRPAEQLRQIWRESIESFLGFIQRKGASPLVRGDRLTARTAVVFSKADLLPGFQRLRPRDAEAYLEKDEGLKDLARNIRLMCLTVKFFFCSAVGWNQGRSNCRVAVIPPELKVQRAAAVPAGSPPPAEMLREGDLIADPPLRDGQPLPPTGLTRPLLPLFTDPMQLIDHRTVNRRDFGIDAGVLCLPGRKSPTSDHDKYLTPWNVVEPLLWAADVAEPR